MKKVSVVGVGALGSHLVQFIRNVDAEITIIDFDRVESKNVLSQFHGKASVGKGKSIGLQQTMNFLYGVKLTARPTKLIDSNVQVLLGESNLVVDCLDNGASRQIVQSFVRKNGIPCLHSALAPNGGFGRVIWDEHFVIDHESQGEAATCENGEHLPFIAITAAYAARAVQLYLDKGTKVGYSVTPAGCLVT